MLSIFFSNERLICYYSPRRWLICGDFPRRRQISLDPPWRSQISDLLGLPKKEGTFATIVRRKWAALLRFSKKKADFWLVMISEKMGHTCFDFRKLKNWPVTIFWEEGSSFSTLLRGADRKRTSRFSPFQRFRTVPTRAGATLLKMN